ncbi:PAS domain-containing protein [Paracoccus sp. DMF-8]|uniref:PAS domain-containing protein n=1 Tax=Paracoccus sp. DMF-8 TaxID=3019445 RepID=UPI003204E277
MPAPSAEELIEAVPNAMLAVDRSTRLILANAAARELFGAGPVGRPFVTAIRHPQINDAVETHSGRDRARARRS